MVHGTWILEYRIWLCSLQGYPKITHDKQEMFSITYGQRLVSRSSFVGIFSLKCLQSPSWVFFNLEISPLWRGCWHCPVSSRKRVNLRRWRGQIVIFLISAFTTPHLPAWFSISLYSGKCWSLCEAEVLVPPAPTLTKRWRLAHTTLNYREHHKGHHYSRKNIELITLFLLPQ